MAPVEVARHRVDIDALCGFLYDVTLIFSLFRKPYQPSALERMVHFRFVFFLVLDHSLKTTGAAPSHCNLELLKLHFTPQELLLAATAHGLASCPMEGFDMRRLRKAFHLPMRYSVPIVVGIGYPSELRSDAKTLR